MEFVEGQDLKEWIRTDAPFRVGQALDVIVQICTAVGFAHDQGLLHCDLKPQNVLVLPDGQVKVTDFGIARALSSDAARPQRKAWGTPHYASPELIAGKTLTPASDQYAIGIMFYELLAGRLPFDGQNVVEIARQHALSAPPPIHHENPRVPRYLEQILDRILAKDPTRRYPSVKQLGKLLAAYRQRGEALTQPLPAIPRTALEAAPRPAGVLATPPTGLTTRPIAAPSTHAAPAAPPPQRRRRVDWLMLILAALAFVAVMGLAPLWATVLSRAMEAPPIATPDPGLATPTPTIQADQPSTQVVVSAATQTAVPLVQVPNLVGMDEAAAQRRAREHGLELHVNKQDHYPAVPASHIYSQTPPPGAQAPAGSAISVVISLGPEPVTVPNVTGFPAAVKQLELEDLGLVVTITETKSTEPAGLILTQDPAAGAAVQAGSTITLTVSNGAFAQIRANLDNKVMLYSAELNSTTFHPGDIALLSIVWQVLNPIPDAYTTFIHVTDAGGKIVTQLDRPPLEGRQPTNTWTTGAELTDAYSLILPRSISPGMYEVQIGLYKGDNRLPITDPGLARARADAVIVHQIKIVDQ
jgi:serine/threonine-protein kinase